MSINLTNNEMIKCVNSMPRQEAYQVAIEEILDVPGLAKLKSIMEKYNLSFVVIDFNLQIACKRKTDYCPKNSAH